MTRRLHSRPPCLLAALLGVALAAPAPAAAPPVSAPLSAPTLVAAGPLVAPSEPAAAQPRRLAQAARLAPAQSLLPATLGARDELRAMAAWNASGGRPRQIGFARPLAAPLVFDSAALPARGVGGDAAGGRWVRAADGGLVWGARLRVAGARRLRLRLHLPELVPGLRLWTWGDGEEPRRCDLGARSPQGDLWTPSVAGEDLFLELALPAGAPPTRFTADAVLELHPGGAGDDTAPPACLLDAACLDAGDFPALDAAARAVAHLEIVDGARGLTPRALACTGTLLNDRDPATTRPYLLTAHHCLATAESAASLEAFFDLRPATCGGPAPDLAAVPRVGGASLLATSEATDTTLLELAELPPGRALLGWTTAPLAHHATLHRLSHPLHLDAPLAQSYARARHDVRYPACFRAPRPEFLYSRLERGGTLGGSSGAATMLSDGTVVGQLLGTCGDDAKDPCDAANGEVDGALAAAYPLLAPFLDAPAVTTCVPSPKVLCLDGAPGDRRFRVEAAYATVQGDRRTGAGAAVSLAALGMPQAGLFTFFAGDNPELLVKLLDGCALNGRYWLFAAAASNSGLTLSVTDTTTGSRRLYSSLDLATAQPVLDAMAFPCAE